MYKSSTKDSYVLKYGFLFTGFIVLVGYLIILGTDDTRILYKEVLVPYSLRYAFIPMIICPCSVYYYFYVGRRITIVEVNSQKLEYQLDGQVEIKSWEGIVSIRKYWMVTPPLYIVNFENPKENFFFTTGGRYISTPIYVFDNSDMGKFIESQRKMLNI